MSTRRKKEVKRSLDGRVAKTVFFRLMLEESRLSGTERLLRGYHAVLPGHWYIATRREIASAEIRPRASVEDDATAQLRIFNIPQGTSCHTNHFQEDRSPSWQWDDNCKESEQRLKRLRSLTQRFSSGADQAVSTGNLLI
jgi:hypothetical protein